MANVALDLALALHEAPAQRERLRSAPLPEGVDEVIALAAEVQPLLGDTAASLGKSEAAIVEACRFYVQQVLLATDTDAYRILGTCAEAWPGVARARRNYRLLQRWLHPDAASASWESVFAARVSWAWHQVKDERSRHAYDAARNGLPTPMAATVVPVPVNGGWQAVPVRRTTSWKRKVWGGVAVLALGGGATWALLASLPGVPPAVSLRGLPEGGRLPERGAGVEVAVPAGNVIDELVRQPSSPVSAPTDVGLSMAAMGASEPVHAGAALHLRLRPLVVDRVNNVSLSPVNRIDGSIERRHVLAASSNQVSAFDPVAGRTPGLSVPGNHPTSPNAGEVVDASRSTAAPASTTAAVPAMETLARVELAQRQFRALAAYFHSDGSTQMPGWADAASAVTVRSRRAVLLARNGLASAPQFSVGTPFWRADGLHASVRADYRVTDRAGTEHGVLLLELVWEGGGWRIRQLVLEPQP